MRDRRLLQGAGDAAEGRGQLRAETVHDGDDRNRDARGDQPVFDGGRAGLVAQEGFDQAHLVSPDLERFRTLSSAQRR